MKFKIVQLIDGAGWIVSEFNSADDLIAGAEIRGYAFAGLNDGPASKRQRDELKGQPKLAGLNGPMWDGVKDGQPVIRYEDVKAYAALSA